MLQSGIWLIASLMDRPSLVARDLTRFRKSTTGKLGEAQRIPHQRGKNVNVKSLM